MARPARGPRRRTQPRSRDASGRTPPGRRPTRSDRRRGVRSTAAGRPDPGISSGLQDMIRTYGASAVRRAGKPTTLSSTMTSGACLAMISRSCGSQNFGPVDQRLPGRLHEGRQLVDGRLPELRRRVADEVLPELAGILLRGVRRRRRGEVDEILDEPERLEAALPRCLRGEYDAVALPAQDVADADAVVRRAVGRLRHEQDGDRLRHHAPRGGGRVPARNRTHRMRHCWPSCAPRGRRAMAPTAGPTAGIARSTFETGRRPPRFGSRNAWRSPSLPMATRSVSFRSFGQSRTPARSAGGGPCRATVCPPSSRASRWPPSVRSASTRRTNRSWSASARSSSGFAGSDPGRRARHRSSPTSTRSASAGSRGLSER